MKTLELEVRATTSIKGKRPWPRIVWVGKEPENLFLLDAGRISVLYVSSGQTKRKISRLSPLVKSTAYNSCTKNGLFVVGLLESGNVFLWHKDQDFLKMVTGLSNIAPTENIRPGNSRLFVSDDCLKILVILNNSLFYLWQMDAQESINNPRDSALYGRWMQINVPDKIPIPSSDCSEATLSALFYSSQVLGDCCQCSVVFNDNNKFCVSTLHLRFSELQHINNDSVLTVQWSSNQYPMQTINADCEPIRAKGSYVVSYSQDGQVLAVAANQRRPVNTCMLFLSPLTETFHVSDMRGCGVANPGNKSGRWYWVCDMSWTYDSLFLACILNNGSVCLLSRLGEPLAIHTSGYNIDMGPSRFLPLHPIILIQQDQHADIEPQESVEDPFRQMVSVSAHPSLPVFLFSDGYTVTVVQLPHDINCLTFMRDLVIDSTKHLNHIRESNSLNMSLANAYNVPSDRTNHHSAARKKDSGKDGHLPSKSRYMFEEPDALMNETQDSEVSFALESNAGFPQIQNLSSGKIMFGEPEMILATCDASFLSMQEQEAIMEHLKHAKLSLFTSWKLSASCSEPWTEGLDKMAKQTISNIVKMFTLILDCSEVNSLVQTTTRVKNPGLFQVVTVYRKMLEVLQFDIFQQHLIPVALQLANSIVHLIMNSPGLAQLEPRLNTLNGCFDILKFTERKLNQNYVWFPKSVSSKLDSPQRHLYPQDQFEPAVAQTPQVDHSKSVALLSSQLISKRLAAIWSSLYENLIAFQSSQCKTEEEYRRSQNLMCAIQETLQLSETPIPQHVSDKVNPGDKHSVDGHHTQALNAWKEQLKEFAAEENHPKAAKLMHSLLYTHLIQGELLTAVDFVDHLILRANVPASVDVDHLSLITSLESRLPLMTLVTDTLKPLAFESPDMVPCIQDRSIRQVVQTMARFMAAYFSNKAVYVFPPHNPQPLPAIHWDTAIVNKRIILQYHEDISRLIRQNNLSAVWNVQRTLEYLLLSGLVCEATWFADTLGDWKASFLMAVACTHHRAIAPTVYNKPRKPLLLPEFLSPSNILQRKLKLLINHGNKDAQFDSKTLTQDTIIVDNTTDLHQLTQTLEDIMTTAVVSRVDIVPWLFTELVDSLRTLVSNFQTIVPQDFYLPAPPLYCPQPTDQSAAEKREIMLRRRAASIIQLILAVLKASHLSLSVISWYVNALNNIQEKACSFKANTEGPCCELPEMLEQFLSVQTPLSLHDNSKSVQTVLQGFRDFCTIMWMIHSRDMLSQNLRNREKYLEKISYQDYTKTDWERTEHEKWMKECFTNLQWAVNLLAFSRFLPDEGSIYKIVLSLLMELPQREDVADILAEFFYDMENLDAEVQEKLDKILFDWQMVIVKPEDDGKSAKECAEDDANDGRKSVTFFDASPRGKSLSVYFHKQSQIMGKVLKKKSKCFGSYSEFVFDPSDNHSQSKLNIGSRPFETRLFYFEFLDTFASVCFARLLENEPQQLSVKNYPLLAPWVDEISSLQLSAFAEKSSGSAEKKHSLVVLKSSQDRTHNVQRREDIQNLRKECPRHLFADHSKEDLMKAEGLFRSRSVTNIAGENSSDDLVDYVSVSERNRVKGSQQNLSELAARFSHSEEALYKQPEHPEHHGWSLNVNFGRKYMPLAKRLEWLEAWNKKLHSLGMGSREQKFEFRPRIKISIPAQLILLSVWLLEHKYNPNRLMPVCPPHPNPLDNRLQKKRIKHIDRTKTGSPNDSLRSRSSISKQRQTPLRSSLQRSRSLSPQQSSKGGSPDSGSVLNRSDLLEEQSVQTAYKQLLNGPEDSSSLEVSSLDTEDLNAELRATYQSLKRTGSPNRQESISQSMLRRTLLQHGESPDRRHGSRLFSSRSPVDKLRKSSSLKGSLNHQASLSAHRSQSRSPSPHTGRNPSSPRHSPSRSPSPHTGRSPSSPHRGRSQLTTAQQVSGTGDLAHQLQNIVRTEMRRIMEVQHKSLMAMMGAIDDPDQETSIGSRTGIKDGDKTLHVEELHSSRSRGAGRGSQVRGILKELKNLQQRVDEPHQFQSLQDLSHRGRNAYLQNKENLSSLPLDISALRGSERYPNVYPAFSQERDIPLYEPDRIPKFLRIPAEKDTSSEDLHLPRVPLQAWSEDSMPPAYGSSFTKMPLLRLDGGYPHSNLFHSFHNPAEEHFPLFPAPQESVLTHQRPAGDVPLVPMPSHPIPSGPFGIPLLRISRPDTQFMNVIQPSFGRFVDPSAVLAHEEEIHKQEMEKQKHLQDFHKHLVHDHTELDAQRFGEQLLRVDLKTQKVREDYEEKRSRSQSPRRTQRMSPTRSQTPQSPQISSVHEEEESQEYETEKEQEENEYEESAETANEKLNDGYAMRPGAFEAYLELGKELGINDDTDAKFQYQLAMKLKQQQKRRRKKVDFSTMTQELIDSSMATDPAMEVVRTAEAATSITKDTGTDPIQEALIEYNRTRQGGVLPPDIFLGLKFGDQPEEQGMEVKEKGRGRSYLNVVDIRASTVLKDIAEKPSEDTIQADATLKGTSLTLSQARKAREDMDVFEESLRTELEPRRRPTYDSVTVRMFETHARGRETGVSVAVMPREVCRESKMAMIKRLCEMNHQMEAIDRMSQNIESDFQNTKLLVNTIERIGEAIDPQVRSTEMQDEDIEAQDVIPSPKVSSRSPKIRAQVASRMSKSAEISPEISRISGLSGISDIIGEIIAEGGIDLEEAGLSPREADRLAKQARKQPSDDNLRVSMEKLKNIVSQTELKSDKHDSEWREEIREWMEEKRQERQEAYKKHRADLREREVKPYKPSREAELGTLGSEALLETRKDREEMREKQKRQNMMRRMQEAELLVGSLIVEKPDLPPSPRKETLTKTSPKLTQRSASVKMLPVQSRRAPTDAAAHKILKPTIARKGPTVSTKQMVDRTRTVKDDVQKPRRGILKRSISPSRELDIPARVDSMEADLTMGSSTELLDYAYAVEQMEREQLSYREPQKQVSRPEPEQQADIKPYKPKSFKQLVRLQRPEVTRKVAELKPDRIPMPGPTDFEQNISQSRQTTARDSTVEEKMRLYGSKHIPSSSKVINVSPRRVKTYTERLQEMKPRQKYSTPIIPHQHLSASARTPSVRSVASRRPKGPPHKPQTYVEQLQKLNAGAVKKFKGSKTVTIQPRTVLKARKPIHKPKTYSEQLRALQPPKELYRTERSQGRKTVLPRGRGTTRSRPYSDPYRTMQEDIDEGWDVKSELSDWTVDDYVKELIYGDDASSMYYPVGSVDYQMSEGVSDYFDYVMGDDYTASVDVDEIANIADAASIDSGSVLSVIDWDAVDQIIADVD
ncbi:uncharacterized protein LOC121374415 [Gigantopelta aegis]|uniref:uncharacterized protein LOC121374415 n=1 Tax=Gigantopelta aegis TaxID=1735272 RepID=UPI001B88C8AB|nr:uncharacterized protein LOC121374415 [Gigantopelta aegis]